MTRSIRPRLVLATGVFLLWASRPAAALAQDTDTPSQVGAPAPVVDEATLHESADVLQDKFPALARKLLAGADAATLHDSGQVLTHENRYELARRLLARAYALDPRSATLLALGLAEYLAGRPVEAVAHLQQYVGRGDALPTKVDEVNTYWLLEAQKQIATLAIYVPEGAEIVIDGIMRGGSVSGAAVGPGVPAPRTVLIREGEHDVVAHLGTAEGSQHVTAKGGARVEVHLDPQPPAVEPARPLQPAQDAIAPESRATNASSKWTVVLALGGASVVAAGIATAFHVSFLQNSSDVNRLSHSLGPSGCLASPSPLDCSTLHADRNEQRTSAALADGFAVGAGVLALGAVVSWAFWPAKHTTTGMARLLPVAGPGQAGLLLTQSW